eukprot:459526_1
MALQQALQWRIEYVGRLDVCRFNIWIIKFASLKAMKGHLFHWTHIKDESRSCCLYTYIVTTWFGKKIGYKQAHGSDKSNKCTTAPYATDEAQKRKKHWKSM